MKFTAFAYLVPALLSLDILVHAVPQQQNQWQSQTPTSSYATVKASTIVEASVATGTTACNNSPLLCNRNYNNITQLGAHDSAFLRDSSTNYNTAGNQFYNATVALSAGVRLLQAQVHNLNGVLELCHTSCSILDAGSLETYLSAINYWMDNNPSEVVTLLLVNSDNNSTASFGTVFTSSGISKYGYTPPSQTAMATWPTLQTLITADTRLITFIASIDYSTSYPYLLPEFNYVFETAYDVTSTTDLNCTLNRPSTQSSATTAIAAGYMGLINHFLDTVELLGITIPDVSDIASTNNPSTTISGALGLQAAKCATQWQSKPQFLLVDFWNVGPAIATADLLNGVTNVTQGRTSVSTNVLTATTSGAAAAAEGGNEGVGRRAVVALVLAGLVAATLM